MNRRNALGTLLATLAVTRVPRALAEPISRLGCPALRPARPLGADWVIP